MNKKELQNNARYLTSKIVERVTSTLIKTKKRPYVLEGKLSIVAAKKYETPQFIINSFSVSILLFRLIGHIGTIGNL